MEGQLKNGTILTSESGNKYEVADDPFAPANNGAPLVLDMSNIPNPDDFDEGAVW